MALPGGSSSPDACPAHCRETRRAADTGGNPCCKCVRPPAASRRPAGSFLRVVHVPDLGLPEAARADARATGDQLVQSLFDGFLARRTLLAPRPVYGFAQTRGVECERL